MGVSELLLTYIAWCSLFLAIIPALLFLRNLMLYKAPPPSERIEPVSVLIPARNEERSIEASVRAVLASEKVDLEVIILDDRSEDRTAQIVRQIALSDARVRLLPAPLLPEGWCGKQFACSILADLATKPIFCFIDADVEVTPSGVARMATALRTGKTDLISGLPCQITLTPFEQLLIPLMHFILLGFLPIGPMRRSQSAAFAAGCGQILVVGQAAYRKIGGHASIRASRHDGLALPRAFRRAGFRTDLCDVTPVASCRMYRSTREVFAGLLKNATEGLGSPGRIIPFSFVLLVGQVLPVFLFAYAQIYTSSPSLSVITAAAMISAYMPRLIAAFRFRQPLLAALLHPVAITLLLGIQWFALGRSLLGVPATWKGRSYFTP